MKLAIFVLALFTIHPVFAEPRFWPWNHAARPTPVNGRPTAPVTPPAVDPAQPPSPSNGPVQAQPQTPPVPNCADLEAKVGSLSSRVTGLMESARSLNRQGQRDLSSPRLIHIFNEEDKEKLSAIRKELASIKRRAAEAGCDKDEKLSASILALEKLLKEVTGAQSSIQQKLQQAAQNEMLANMMGNGNGSGGGGAGGGSGSSSSAGAPKLEQPKFELKLPVFKAPPPQQETTVSIPESSGKNPSPLASAQSEYKTVDFAAKLAADLVRFGSFTRRLLDAATKRRKNPATK